MQIDRERVILTLGDGGATGDPQCAYQFGGGPFEPLARLLKRDLRDEDRDGTLTKSEFYKGVLTLR